MKRSLFICYKNLKYEKYNRMENQSAKEMVIGIGFYKREQWPLLLETAADADRLEKTYDEWVEVLDSTLEKLKSQGIGTELVEVDVNDLLAYCKKKKIRNDGKARSGFIVELTGEKNSKKKGKV